MNDLEQWLADVRAFNESAKEASKQNLALWKTQHDIASAGRALGLKRSKIKSMLASVRLKVEMPEDKNAKDG